MELDIKFTVSRDIEDKDEFIKSDEWVELMTMPKEELVKELVKSDKWKIVELHTSELYEK